LKPASQYYYRVRAVGKAGPSEYSTETMTETPSRKQVKILYPNGGEVIDGNELVVRFTADPTIGGFKVYFFTAENFWFQAKRWTENNGYYVFSDFASLVNSKTYKIRLASSDPSLYDESDGFFEVKSGGIK
jgi:hypothetical protein